MLTALESLAFMLPTDDIIQQGYSLCTHAKSEMKNLLPLPDTLPMSQQEAILPAVPSYIILWWEEIFDWCRKRTHDKELTY